MIKFKKKILALMIPAFLLSISSSAIINAQGRNASEDTGNMTINKTATAVEGNPREFEIALQIKPVPEKVEEKKPIDVMVVVDTSGSMSWDMNGKSRIEIIKGELRKFYNNIIANQENEDIRFSLVSFDGQLPTTLDKNPASNNAQVITKFGDNFLTGINKLNRGMNKSEGATNTHMGLKTVYDNFLTMPENEGGIRENAIPYVVLFTDGVPTVNGEATSIKDITYNENCNGEYSASSLLDIDGSDIAGYDEFDNNEKYVARKMQYRVNSADAAKRLYDKMTSEYSDMKFVTIGLYEGIDTDKDLKDNFIKKAYNIYGKDYNDFILAQEFIPYMQNIQPGADYTNYKYYVENRENDLAYTQQKIQEAFSEISYDIIETYYTGAKDVVIEDIVTEYFEMIPGTYTAWIPGENGGEDIQIDADKFSVEVDYENNTVRFKFAEIGPRGVIVKFHIEPTNDYFGGNHIYTNEEAKLYYKDIVTGEDKEQTFNVPYVDLDFIHGKITAVKHIKDDVEPSKYNKTTFPITIKGGQVEKTLSAELVPYEVQEFDFILIDKDTIILNDEYNNGNEMNFLYIGDYFVEELVPMNYKFEGMTINGVDSNTFNIDKDNSEINIIVTNSITNDNYFYDQDKTPNKLGQLISETDKGDE